MIYLCLLCLLFSCSAHYYSDAAAQLREGRFEEAEKSLAKADLPYSRCNESPLLLLSRGMVYFQTGKFSQSSHDFEKALDAIDYYKQKSSAEIAGQIALQDDWGAYVPPLFEETLARFYQALALLHQGEEDNAAASVYYLENHLDAAQQNPLTTYLLAALLQRRGDASNARILYARLGLENGKGNVLLVHHRGIAPYKKSEIAPVSIVSAVLLETILAVENVRPALSSLTGVPVPALCPIRPAASAIEIDHRRLQPTLHYDVAMAAESALDEEMTTIATRAAARMLIRRGAVAATKEPYQPLMDIAMLISNAATRADTRSWSMLPSCIDLYHFDLEPGRHQLQAGSRTLDLEVPSKGLTLVEVFQPSSEKINFITKEPS